MATLREIVTLLTVRGDTKKIKRVARDLDLIPKRAEKAAKRIKKTSDEVVKAESKMEKFAGTIRKVATVWAAVFAAKTAFNFIKGFVDAASDAEETSNKFAVVFGAVRDEANQVAANLSKNYGLASSTSKTLLGNTGDLLTGYGFTGKAALDLSRRTQELASDTASFSNFSGGAAGASEALTKALLGERESVKALGIVITEDLIKEELLIQGKSKLTGMALKQAKAEATLAIAYRQSKNSIGDTARTWDDYATVQRRAGENLKDLKETLGRFIIPLFHAGLIAITAFTDGVRFLVPLLKPLVFGLAAVGTVMVGLKIKALILSGAMSKLAIKTMLALWPYIAIAAAVLAAGLVLEDLWVAIQGGDSVIGNWIAKNKKIQSFLEWIRGAVKWVSRGFRQMGDDIQWLIDKLDNLIPSMKKITEFFTDNAITRTLGAIGDFFGGDADTKSQAARAQTATLAGGQRAISVPSITGTKVFITVPKGSNAETAAAASTGVQTGLKSSLNKSLRTTSESVTR